MSVERRCAECNAVLLDDAEFCHDCGAVAEKVQEVILEEVSCSGCGARINPNFDFCYECGNPLNVRKNSFNAPPPVFENVFCPECGTRNSTEFEFCSECGYPLNENKGSNPMPVSAGMAGSASMAKPAGMTGPAGMAGGPSTAGTPGMAGAASAVGTVNAANASTKKPFKLPVLPLIIGASAVIIIAGVLFAVLTMMSRGGSSTGANYLLYAKDKEFQLASLPDVKKLQLTERLIDSSMTLSANDFYEYAYWILISEDNRYIFYPDRINDNDISYYWRDLTEDNTRTDAATRIDRDIVDYPQISKDGSKFFYIKGEERRLNIYDLSSGEYATLAREVSSFFINDAGDYMIYQTYRDGEYSVHEMVINGIVGENNRIDSDARLREVYANDRIVYYINDDYDLYFKEFNKDRVRIAYEIDSIVAVANSTSIYFIKSEEVANKLSTYVSNDLGDDINDEYKENLTENLENEDNAVIYYTDNLYYWSPSSPSGGVLVASDLLNVYNIYHSSYMSRTPLVIYQKNTISTGGIKKLSEYVSEVGYYDPYQVMRDIRYDVYDARKASDDYFIAYQENESVIDCYNARDFAITPDGVVCYLDEYNDDRGYGILKTISVHEGALTRPAKIDDDVMSFRFGNGNANIYYFKDVKNDTGDMFLDTIRIAQDVYINSFYNYKGSDAFLYYSSYSIRNDYGTLNIFKNGGRTKIADDVYFFAPISEKSIAYIKDYNSSRQRGDLVLYTEGGAPIPIDTDVTALIINPNMIG